MLRNVSRDLLPMFCFFKNVTPLKKKTPTNRDLFYKKGKLSIPMHKTCKTLIIVVSQHELAKIVQVTYNTTDILNCEEFSNMHLFDDIKSSILRFISCLNMFRLYRRIDRRTYYFSISLIVIRLTVS